MATGAFASSAWPGPADVNARPSALNKIVSRRRERMVETPRMGSLEARPGPQWSAPACWIDGRGLRHFTHRYSMQAERRVTAAFSPPIIQLRFGFGNRYCVRWLVRRGPTGQTTTEDILMVNRIGIFRLTGRAAILATVAAVALSTVAPTGVNAAPAASGASQHGTSTATDISSAGRRHSRGGGNAAGLAAFGAIVGTIGAIAASQNRHDYYYDR